jgi:hypothetical protein
MSQSSDQLAKARARLRASQAAAATPWTAGGDGSFRMPTSRATSPVTSIGRGLEGLGELSLSGWG